MPYQQCKVSVPADHYATNPQAEANLWPQRLYGILYGDVE